MTTPSAAILAKAAETLTVRDSEGREIALRRLNALDRLRLFKALGPLLSQNAMYLGMASLAVSVVSVDGVPAPVPCNETQLEALIARLGDAGLSAASSALSDADDKSELAEDDFAGN